MLLKVESGIGYTDANDTYVDIADFLRDQGFSVTISKESPVHFKYHLSLQEQRIGRIFLYDNETELNIVGFRTQPQNNQEEFQYLGNGKRALKAIFGFAVAAGRYKEVTTSIFAKTGTGFFLSQGFYNRSPRSIMKGSSKRVWHRNELDIDWDRATNLFPQNDIQKAKQQLGNSFSDDCVFKLARTPIGKVVLWHCGSCGYANLKDTVQMTRINDVIGAGLKKFVT